jgi:hypothetical protein
MATGTTSFVPIAWRLFPNRAAQFFFARRTDEMHGNVVTEANQVVVAGHEKLVANAPVAVREVDRTHAADDAKTQQQMLQLACHPFRSGGIEKAPPLDVDVPVAFPHAADEQPKLARTELKDRGRYLFDGGLLAQQPQFTGPRENARRVRGGGAFGVDRVRSFVQRHRAGDVVETLGGLGIVLALRFIFGVEVDRVWVAKVALRQQMPQRDDFMIGPRAPSHLPLAAGASQFARRLQDLQAAASRRRCRTGDWPWL